MMDVTSVICLVSRRGPPTNPFQLNFSVFSSSLQWATGIALSVDPAQRQCMFMSYGQTYTFNITFSNSPLDGLQVIYNGTNVDTSKVPAGFGALINSQANCFGEGLGPPECVNGVQMVPSPVGPGFTLLTYVETHNLTISNGPASLRREWFLGKFSNESVVVPGSTLCLSTLSQSLLTDLNMVQARLRFNTFYTVQTVSKSNLFLVVFGSVGGAYSLFIQFGSVVISFMSIWMVISTKTQVVREKVVRSLTMSLSMRRPSLRGNKVMVHDESDLMEKGNGQDDADKEEIEFQRYLSQTSKNTNQNSKEIASTAASTVGGIGVIPVKPSNEIKASSTGSKIVAEMKMLSGRPYKGRGSGHMTSVHLQQLAALSQVHQLSSSPQPDAMAKEHLPSDSGTSSYLSVGSESSDRREVSHGGEGTVVSSAMPAGCESSDKTVVSHGEMDTESSTATPAVDVFEAARRSPSSVSMRSNKVVPAPAEDVN
ncbi:hypothetical protein CEUSTIGMA_g4625.t1 [Chlamydomonas eustigma]|uniref:Uncharacterized protein n=1 Tax=Chlamydomonas eustigma TaxID=1157962 RepID=A0A250X2L2_9CHLO|nr:hypothetical protein CEUSTIGMA_g4625.t1 [Chlamydomonas eustigma]|eukprot:GAX77179.1 hypothetical protein CEUSTIGMA_g4625.t1 [Chlamydomonas eustigma]